MFDEIIEHEISKICKSHDINKSHPSMLLKAMAKAWQEDREATKAQIKSIEKTLDSLIASYESDADIPFETEPFDNLSGMNKVMSLFTQ